MRTTFVYASLFLATACGAKPEAHTPLHPDMPKEHKCGESEKVHAHTLDPHEDGATHAFIPCSGSGKHDMAGGVRVESTPQGVHVIIDATDDDVSVGLPGAELKGRDAVLVWPQGHGAGKKSVEIPLKKTPRGYHGEKTIPYDELEKLSDEGTKLKISVYDHDKEHPEKHEELHVEVAVSSGKSCERARDENPQSLDLGKKPGHKADLTDAELGAPMQSSAFFSHCPLKESENAEICVAVKDGKPLGVSVTVSPSNKGAALCIDRATRKLRFPSSDKLDVVHQKF